MNEKCESKEYGRRLSAVLIAAVLWGCAGCQTFNPRDEEWRAHWDGKADPQVGNAVAVSGTAAYWGLALASLFH